MEIPGPEFKNYGDFKTFTAEHENKCGTLLSMGT